MFLNFILKNFENRLCKLKAKCMKLFYFLPILLKYFLPGTKPTRKCTHSKSKTFEERLSNAEFHY